MNLGSRIKRLRLKMKLGQSSLAELCGWEGSARISNYEHNIREPNISDIETLARVFQVDPGWLQFGSGQISHFESEISSIVPTGCVPLVSLTQVGKFGDPDIIIDENTQFETMVGNGSLKSFALKVVGDSMISPNPHNDSFFPGETIIIDPEEIPENGDFVVAYKEGTNAATFKQYIVDAGSTFLKPLNPQYPIILMDETIKIWGVLISKVSCYKRRK